MAQPYITWPDVIKTFPAVTSFDGKRELPAEEFDNISGNTYTLDDSGYVGRLYRSGADLGDPEDTVFAVDEDGEWIYDEDADQLRVLSTADATTLMWQAAGDSLTNLKAYWMNTGAEVFESYLDNRYPRPLPKSQRTYSGGSYEALIVRLVALFTARQAILDTDPESSALADVEGQLWNENETGLIDQLNAGKIKFEFETTASDKHGEIVEVSTNANTTGYPIETRGATSSAPGKVRVTITTGGTITWGTENSTVTYTATDADGAKYVNAEVINIDEWQPIGEGVEVIFSAGVYTANDAWDVYVRYEPTSEGTIGSIHLIRI